MFFKRNNLSQESEKKGAHEMLFYYQIIEQRKGKKNTHKKSILHSIVYTNTYDVTAYGWEICAKLIKGHTCVRWCVRTHKYTLCINTRKSVLETSWAKAERLKRVCRDGTREDLKKNTHICVRATKLKQTARNGKYGETLRMGRETVHTSCDKVAQRGKK